MDSSATFRVRRADWAADGERLRGVRHAVFVLEQNVAPELEWDAADSQCLHMIAESADGEPIGTGRLLPVGHIGRMAVLLDWRGRGVGSALLQELLDLARSAGFGVVRLNAQTHALAFYNRFGFRSEGEEFSEAGIAHRCMSLIL